MIKVCHIYRKSFRRWCRLSMKNNKNGQCQVRRQHLIDRLEMAIIIVKENEKEKQKRVKEQIANKFSNSHVTSTVSSNIRWHSFAVNLHIIITVFGCCAAPFRTVCQQVHNYEQCVSNQIFFSVFVSYYGNILYKYYI